MDKSKINILVVDDDQQLGQAVLRTLRLHDIHADYFEDPRKAKHHIEHHTVDILLTDYMMPHLNGMELLNHLKHHQPNALGILMTGVDDFSLAVSAINEGSIMHFLTKPFKQDELVEVLSKAIRTMDDHKLLVSLKEIRLSLSASDEVTALQALIHQNVVEGLSHLLQAKDEELFHHSKRISNLCRRFGTYLELGQESISLLAAGALLHDIGKLAIKDQILDKPSKLDADEYLNMKRHPQVGAELLDKLGVHQRIVACVYQHHEYINGAGYPLGLSGDKILVDARIVAIADAYDALRSARSYKAGYDLETTRHMMYGMADIIYDRALLNRFFEFLESKGV